MDDAELTALTETAFEFLCTRRVSELVDGAQLLAALDAAATEPRLARVIARFVAPARERLLARARASELPLSVWLPEPARDALAALLGAPAPIPRAVIDELVDNDQVRDGVRTALHEAFTNVLQKAFAPSHRGLRGMLGRLGEELQRQMAERVREFVDGGVGVLQGRLADKLASDETARQLGRRRRRAFLDLLARPESFVARLAERVAWPFADAILPSLVVHNLARPELRAALAAEVSAVLAELSTQTVGELLDELGLRELARANFCGQSAPLLRAFLSSVQFQRWQKK